MKEPQREAMRSLPLDRKLFLVRQHRQSTFPLSNTAQLRPSKTGPETDSSTLASLKRFSLANVVWGGTEPEPISNRPATMFDGNTSNSTSTTSIASSFDPTTTSIQQGDQIQSPSNWTSWWSSASNATGTGHAVGEQSKDTPQFYVDQLRSK